MTNNVADYITEKRSGYPWPRDFIGDDFYVSAYRDSDHYFILFNNTKRQWDFGITLFDTGDRLYLIGGIFQTREHFISNLMDNFPAPFQWCLFNLDLIGA